MRAITLLDGGMGQELVRRSGQSPTSMWSAQVMLDTPELVEQLHRDFIVAGADIITLNTYAATPERLHRDGHVSLFAALQMAACQVAVKARERENAEHLLIAGCLPPLVASYHPELAPQEQHSRSSYQRIVEAQADTADLFLCETMGSVSEAKIASTVALESGKPVWVAMSLNDRQPELLRSGEPWIEAVNALSDSGIAGFLLNCSRPETITSQWTAFNAASRLPTGAYANGFTSVDALGAGGTVNSLETRQDLGPAAYGAIALEWVEQGATLVGGCCEVGPDHIRYIHEHLAN